MKIKTFISVVKSLPPHISVLAKGPTGIGKSHVYKQIAKNLNMPMIDRRLAIMTEGDLVGLPIVSGDSTKFLPPDWFLECCKNPRVLFLDELNRATREVQNCAFQIILDRELNGHKLHPETRVYAAINVGNEYQVIDMDPALERRFYSRELNPDSEDWLDWARNIKKTIDPVIIEYIERYPSHLRYEEKFQPGKKYPNPASWEMLNDSLIHAGLAPSQSTGVNYNSVILDFAEGFIGQEYSAKFASFIQNYISDYSVKDLIKLYPTKRKVFDSLKNTKKNEMIRKIVDYQKANIMNLSDINICCDFIESCSQEMINSFHDTCMTFENLEHKKAFHARLYKNVLRHLNEIVLEGNACL